MKTVEELSHRSLPPAELAALDNLSQHSGVAIPPTKQNGPFIKPPAIDALIKMAEKNPDRPSTPVDSSQYFWNQPSRGPLSRSADV